MNKLWTSLFLVVFCSAFGWGQGLTCDMSLGLLVHWKGRKSTDFIESIDEVWTENSTFLQISPVFMERNFKRWEFGMRGGFIWNRLTNIREGLHSKSVEKRDLFTLSLGQVTRFYFEYPEQNMRTFLALDAQILGNIGDKEISTFGGLISFGIGGMYQINSNLAVESMITVSLLSLGTRDIRGYPSGFQFWLGFRYCFEKKVTP